MVTSSNITYAITVCNEHVELDRLLNILSYFSNIKTDVYVQCDAINCTTDVLNIVHKYNVRNGKVPFTGNYAEFKNNIYSNCDTEWIFFIDADEYPNTILLDNIDVLLGNTEIDAMAVPRINTVSGLTAEHVKKWNWSLSKIDTGSESVEAVNFPDYQWRIQQNKPTIRWVNPVHEVLSGFITYGRLPAEAAYCLFHPKTIDRQEKQNLRYEQYNK